jgi:hypothetical protein
LETYLEHKLKNYDEIFFWDHITYGINCYRYTSDGKIDSCIIYLDPDEEFFFNIFHKISDIRERINISCLINLIINNKLNPESNKEFFQKTTKKKID